MSHDRHMTLYEELVLLKDFEKRENMLASKLDERLDEKMGYAEQGIDTDQSRHSISTT